MSRDIDPGLAESWPFGYRLKDALSKYPAADAAAIEENLSRLIITPTLDGAVFSRQDAANRLAAIDLDNMMGRTPSEDRAVAFHEAGHAVPARSFGLSVRGVSIRASASEGGFCHYAPGPSWGSLPEAKREEIEAHAIVELAGPIAERLACETLNLVPSDESWQRHQASAAALVLRITGTSGRELENYVAWLGDRAAACVAEHWGEVVLVAEALLVHRELDGEQVDALLGGQVIAA